MAIFNSKLLVYHIITEPKSVGYVEYLDSTPKSPIRDVGSMQGYANKNQGKPFMKQRLSKAMRSIK